MTFISATGTIKKVVADIEKLLSKPAQTTLVKTIGDSKRAVLQLLVKILFKRRKRRGVIWCQLRG